MERRLHSVSRRSKPHHFSRTNDGYRCGRVIQLRNPESAHPMAAFGWLDLINDRSGDNSSPSAHGRECEFPPVPISCRSPRLQFPPKAALWQHVVRVLPAIKSHSEFFSKPAIDPVPLPESCRWIGGTHFLGLRVGCHAVCSRSGLEFH